MTIVLYASKPNSVVILGSTIHHDNKIDDSTGDQKKPEIIKDYNRNKGEIDVVNKLCGEYTVSRECKRWPLTTFFGLMDIAAINALIIYRQNMVNETLILRRVFLKQLALELTKPHLLSRCTIQGLPIHLKKKVCRISGIQEEPQRKLQRRESGRCDDCPRGKDRKTKTSCSNCNKLLCKEHSHVYCGERALE
uniref:PiggyBac transposable element-derived protein domain-containing protein n=1 Tax=Clastoptera arizonana TaxID=38151 RepID=A0A1B6D3N2_9HEMI